MHYVTHSAGDQIMSTHNDPTDRVKEWFERRASGPIKGLETVREGDEGIEIVLARPLPIEDVCDIYDSKEGFEAETQNGRLTISKEKEVNSTKLMRGYATAFYNDDEISLGAEVPIGANLEPTDDTVEEILEVLAVYFEERY